MLTQMEEMLLSESLVELDQRAQQGDLSPEAAELIWTEMSTKIGRLRGEPVKSDDPDLSYGRFMMAFWSTRNQIAAALREQHEAQSR